MLLRFYSDRWLIGILLGLAILPVFDCFTPSQLQVTQLMPMVLIFALIGLGITVATGFTGLLHLGAAGFVAIGAYTFAIATCSIYPFQLPWILAVALAATAGWLAGYVVGVPVIRLRGDYLAIVTLGFGEIVQDVLRNVEVITKGSQGINPLPGPSFNILFSDGSVGMPTSTSNSVVWYYLLFAILAITAFGLQRVLRSFTGRTWLAVRDDELAASSSGIDTSKVKLSSLALSSAICAFGGALMASFLGTSGEPSTYDFSVSIMVLCCVIVGGLGSIPGSILGAVLVVGFNSIVLPVLGDFLASYDTSLSSNVLLSPGNWKYLIFGLALVLMMRFKSDGLLPARTSGVR